jgi:histidinol-phosphate aminotransferase
MTSISTPPSTSAGAPKDPAPLYAPPTTAAPIDLRLDANESLTPALSLDVAQLAPTLDPEALRRYPSTAPLETAIAARWGLSPSRVLVTAGGDEAIDRACRAFLRPGSQVNLPVPTFEMIARYARLAGADIATVDWRDGPYPIDQVLAQINEQTAMIAVVSPNNPTGAAASPRDLERLAREAPHAILLVDCAYAEFADHDLTPAALDLPNAVVIRTFSKAYGLAGLRVGYAIASDKNTLSMRAAGSPFPVAGVSLAIAAAALSSAGATLPGAVSRVRREREQLFRLLADLGAHPKPSQGNFVLADFQNAEWTWRALAGLGIAVRRFPPGRRPDIGTLDSSLRITCPGREAEFDRLCRGLRAALCPQAILFHLDAITGPAAEHASPSRALLERLAARLPLAIITSDPLAECDRALTTLGLRGLFTAVISTSAVPTRPATSPATPATLVLEKLGVEAAWFIACSPDDMHGARAAGVVPIGILPPANEDRHTPAALEKAGAARILGTLDELEALLP